MYGKLLKIEEYTLKTPYYDIFSNPYIGYIAFTSTYTFKLLISSKDTNTNDEPFCRDFGYHSWSANFDQYKEAVIFCVEQTKEIKKIWDRSKYPLIDFKLNQKIKINTSKGPINLEISQKYNRKNKYRGQIIERVFND